MKYANTKAANAYKQHTAEQRWDNSDPAGEASCIKRLMDALKARPHAEAVFTFGIKEVETVSEVLDRLRQRLRRMGNRAEQHMLAT